LLVCPRFGESASSKVDSAKMTDFRISRAGLRVPIDAPENVLIKLWPEGEISLKEEWSSIRSATRGQALLYRTLLFAREADNGGVRQFLTNSAGMFANEIASDLRLLSVYRLTQPLALILRQLGRPFPHGWEERRAILLGVPIETWAAVSKSESDIYKEGGYEAALGLPWRTYLQRHPSDFFLD
jgi:hypothetical protein